MARLNKEACNETLAINRNNAILFVVDMINGFCKKGAMADPDIMNIVLPITELCKNMLPLKRTYFITDCHGEDDIEFKSFPKHCLKGTEESKVVDELLKYVEQGFVIEKNSTNAFHSFINKDEFFKHCPEKIIITGCCTDICVMQFAISFKTFLNSMNLEKQVIVPIDCVDTYDAPHHKANLRNEDALTIMKEAGIEIVDNIDLQVY